MGVVKILITDETEDDCVIVVDYEGTISDKLKDVLSCSDLNTFIVNGLSEKDFFAENSL